MPGSLRGRLSVDSIDSHPSSSPSFLFYAPCLSDECVDVEKDWSEDDGLPSVRTPIRNRRLTISSVGSGASFTRVPALPKIKLGLRKPPDLAPLAPRSLRSSLSGDPSAPTTPFEGNTSPMMPRRSPRNRDGFHNSPSESSARSSFTTSSPCARAPVHRRRSTVFPFRQPMNGSNPSLAVDSPSAPAPERNPTDDSNISLPSTYFANCL
jgi:hypothetical protein